MQVSEGISVLQDVLSEEWESLKSRISEIRVKGIRVNQGGGVCCFAIEYYLKHQLWKQILSTSMYFWES